MKTVMMVIEILRNMSIKLYTQKETTSDISCLGRNMFLFCFFAWK